MVYKHHQIWRDKLGIGAGWQDIPPSTTFRTTSKTYAEATLSFLTLLKSNATPIGVSSKENLSDIQWVSLTTFR